MNFIGTSKIGAVPITATLGNGKSVTIAAGCVTDLPSTNRFVQRIEAQGYIERVKAKKEKKRKKRETETKVKAENG